MNRKSIASWCLYDFANSIYVAVVPATIWAAYYLGDEKTLGSIEPGKLADFVILDGDYMKVPEDKISDLKAIMTVIDGKVVYEVPGQL